MLNLPCHARPYTMTHKAIRRRRARLVGKAILKLPLAHLCVMMHGAVWTLPLFCEGHCARVTILEHA